MTPAIGSRITWRAGRNKLKTGVVEDIRQAKGNNGGLRYVVAPHSPSSRNSVSYVRPEWVEEAK